MFEATHYPANDHSIDSKSLKPLPSAEMVSTSTVAKPITPRSNDDRRGKKPRNLYAVKVYDRRVAERRHSVS